MKKVLLLAFAVLGICGNASADIIKTQAQAKEAGLTLTVTQLNAFKDTGKRFAFHTTQRTDWSTFDTSSTGVNDLSTYYLYSLVSGSVNGTVCVKNFAGEILTDAGNGSNSVWSSDPSAKGFNWKFVQPDDGTAPAYASNQQVRFRNTAGLNYRANNRDFSTAAGDWARYVAYGPFYIVNVKCECSDAGFKTRTISLIASAGTFSVEAPELDGYTATELSKEVTVTDEDITVTFNYTQGEAPFKIINITPRPKTVKREDGILTLPSMLTVGGTGLSEATMKDVEKFVADFNASATGYTASASSSEGAFITLTLDSKLSATTYGSEGYKLTVTEQGVQITAPSETGLYYGLVTIKKLLPACVTIGVKDARFTEYSLPYITIDDAPRFKYRGFMLDCSRHFYTVEEIKRVLNLMAVYKMNRFHWHLTDDQGWRAEIKKYPKLTTVAATAPNSWMVDRVEGPYWTNEPYGPYFYTQDDMREVVAYAAERHIEIVPEIEFPGHALACMAAYPEFSCNPGGTHGGLMPYGVSSDVLNVANEGAMQFVRDVLDEIMDIFPGELIHIGGDECPTSAWSNNAECKKKMTTLGLSNIRALQSHFNKDVADHIGKRGHRLATWNESIDAEGADTELMASTNATVWCWTNAWGNATKAAQMGLDAMLTPWTRGYINRAQSRDFPETYLPGDGSDNVQNVYGIDPMPSGLTTAQQKHIIGVQGTFWCENIGTPDMMEHMALPRLMCMAETGWTAANLKDFSDFQTRMRRDTVMLNLGGYEYGRHIIDDGSTTPSALETAIEQAKVVAAVPTFTGKAVLGRYSAESVEALKAVIVQAEAGEADAADLEKAVAAVKATMPRLEAQKSYRFRNNIARYKDSAISYTSGQYLQHSAEEEAATDWIVTMIKDNADGTQSVKLKNAKSKTSKYFGSNSTQKGRQMWPVLASGTAQYVTVTFRPEYADYNLTINGKDLVPVAHTMDALPGIITSGNCNIDANAELPALHVQGAAWVIDEVVAITLLCEDAEGKKLEEHRYVVGAGETIALQIPAIDGYNYESGMPEKGVVASENTTYVLKYVKPVPESISPSQLSPVNSHLSTSYDLQGKRQAGHTQGIVIKGNEKVLTK